MKKNFICVLFTFTFETAKWVTLYNLQFQRRVVHRLGYPVSVLETVQRLVEPGQFQVDGPDGEVDVSGRRTLLAFVVQRVPGVRQGPKARSPLKHKSGGERTLPF